MRWQQITGGLAMTAAMGMTLWGCPKEKPADTPAATTTDGTPRPPVGGKINIVVIPKGTANSFWQTINAGAQAAGKEDNVEVNFDGPAKETDNSEQINMVQNYVTKGVKGI